MTDRYRHLREGPCAHVASTSTMKLEDQLAIVADQFAYSPGQTLRSAAWITGLSGQETGTRHTTVACCCGRVLNDTHRSPSVAARAVTASVARDDRKKQ